jgi:hypothetical protein
VHVFHRSREDGRSDPLKVYVFHRSREDERIRLCQGRARNDQMARQAVAWGRSTSRRWNPPFTRFRGRMHLQLFISTTEDVLEAH